MRVQQTVRISVRGTQRRQQTVRVVWQQPVLVAEQPSAGAAQVGAQTGPGTCLVSVTQSPVQTSTCLVSVTGLQTVWHTSR